MAADDHCVPKVVVDRSIGQQGGRFGTEDREAELEPAPLGQDEFQEITEALIIKVKDQATGAACLHVEAHFTLTAGIPLWETGPLALSPREL